MVDGRGNVVALLDQSGTVVDSYSYDAWGRPLSVSELLPQRLRYGGYWDDVELGWYWAGVRSYDPQLMRWLQPDPSQHEGVRTYIYANDDPLDVTDPTGLDSAGIYGTSASPTPAPVPAPTPTPAPARSAAPAPTGTPTPGTSQPPATQVRPPAYGGSTVPGDPRISPYWLGEGKAPERSPDGRRILEGYYKRTVYWNRGSSSAERTDTWRAHYDQQGRIVGRTDYSEGMRPHGRPEVHYHPFTYGPSGTYDEESHLPGVYAEEDTNILKSVWDYVTSVLDAGDSEGGA